VSIGHAHTGQSGTLVGIAAISLARNSKVARRSAQKENSRRPAAGTNLLDHRKIPPIRRLSLGNCRRGDEVQAGICRSSSPGFPPIGTTFALDLSSRARDLGWQGQLQYCNRRCWRLCARA
jgi:hypothetical protein